MQLKAVISMDGLKAILNPITALCDEAILTISEEGIAADVVDPANCAMLRLKAGAGAFDYLKVEGSGEIAMDMAQLSNLLVGSEPVTLEISDQKMGVKTGKMEYDLRLIDPSAVKRPPRIPELSFAACVDIPAKELSEALKGAMRMAGKKDDIVVIQDDEKFSLLCKTPGAGFRAIWPLSEVRVRDGESRSVMAMDYMSDIAAALAGTVTIESGIDSPLVLSAKNGEIATVFMLAPRLEQDE